MSTEPAASRICFVIMPFSSTASCSEEEWTDIFENLLKPAIEQVGLGYRCVRSTATRGNLVAAIMESLRDAHVVLADLTDQNPNVFYELGVRHALKDRTILIAQDRSAIPFDLRPYANHVYDWKTEQGRDQLRNMIKDLLLDVDSSPDRPDNPVSDCLKSRASMPEEAEPQPIEPRQAVNAQPLAGPGSEGLDSAQLALRLSAQTDLAGVRTVVRLTRTYFLDAWPTRMHDLNSGASASETVLTSQIYDQSLSIVRMFSADIELVEEFGLGIIEAGSVPLVSQTMRIVEDWIALSERAWPGTTRKTVVGTPSLLALRLLAVWGAKAADDDSHRCLATLLGTPLSSVEFNGRPSHLPVVDRRDLFWPAAMLDYADLGVHYLRDEPWTNARVQPFFASLDDYLAGLSVFLFVAALIYGARHSTAGWPMYPGFKLIPKASHAIQRFMARVATNSDAVEALARLVPETPEEFQANWGERVGSLNAASLGGRYDINIDWRRIPGRFEDLAGRSPDD